MIGEEEREKREEEKEENVYGDRAMIGWGTNGGGGGGIGGLGGGRKHI